MTRAAPSRPRPGRTGPCRPTAVRYTSAPLTPDLGLRAHVQLHDVVPARRAGQRVRPPHAGQLRHLDPRVLAGPERHGQVRPEPDHGQVRPAQLVRRPRRPSRWSAGTAASAAPCAIHSCTCCQVVRQAWSKSCRQPFAAMPARIASASAAPTSCSCGGCTPHSASAGAELHAAGDQQRAAGPGCAPARSAPGRAARAGTAGCPAAAPSAAAGPARSAARSRAATSSGPPASDRLLLSRRCTSRSAASSAGFMPSTGVPGRRRDGSPSAASGRAGAEAGRTPGGRAPGFGGSGYWPGTGRPTAERPSMRPKGADGPEIGMSEAAWCGVGPADSRVGLPGRAGMSAGLHSRVRAACETVRVQGAPAGDGPPGKSPAAGGHAAAARARGKRTGAGALGCRGYSEACTRSGAREPTTSPSSSHAPSVDGSGSARGGTADPWANGSGLAGRDDASRGSRAGRQRGRWVVVRGAGLGASEARQTGWQRRLSGGSAAGVPAEGPDLAAVSGWLP